MLSIGRNGALRPAFRDPAPLPLCTGLVMLQALSLSSGRFSRMLASPQGHWFRKAPCESVFTLVSVEGSLLPMPAFACSPARDRDAKERLASWEISSSPSSLRMSAGRLPQRA